MSPAFSSNRQAAAFVALVALLIALPMLMANTGRPDRRDVYPTVAIKYGPFSYIQQKIFDESGDVDVAFVGSSEIWCAIDTPYVQEKFSEHLGREAQVFTLGWPWPGFDALYVITRDLLEHRHVKLLVVYDESRNGDSAHTHSSRWFLMNQSTEVFDGLSLKAQARFYGGAVLGIPRHLLSLARPNLLEAPEDCRPNFWNSYYHAPNIAQRLGSLRARLAFNVRPDFVPFTPRGGAAPGDFLLYSEQTRNAFEFSASGIDDYQLRFARKLAELCREKGTRLVFLHTPQYNGRGKSVIRERLCWPEALGPSVDLIGIPPDRLFSGISADDTRKLFYENGHFNENGQDFFTPLITPVLLKLHADTTHTH